MPPNIILIVCDQLRAFELGCYGNAVIQTPHLDRLAAEGLRCQTAISNYPVCLPARSILISGQHNRSCTGGIGNVSYASRPGDFNMPEYPYAGRPHLPDPTLPELLRAQGYHTAAIGKWHIHSWPHEVGFDHFVIPRVHHCHTGQSYTEDGGPEFVPPGYSVDFECERALALLRERRQSPQPFFLYYNLSPPHCPLADAPAEYRTMYAPEEVPLRPNVDLSRPLKDQDYWFKVYRHDFRYYGLRLPFTETLPEGYSLRHLIAEYYGLTTWVDHTVGRLLAALRALPMWDNTVVVFTSDHGDNLGSHGLVQKGGPNEEAIRIPLILHGPGIKPGVQRSHVSSLVDLAPTLLRLAGGTPPAHWHGRDLAGLYGGGPGPADTAAVVETRGGIGWRSPRELYYLPFTAGGRTLAEQPTQFYDLARDPYQLNNLATRLTTARQARAAPLAAALRTWDARIPWRTLPA